MDRDGLVDSWVAGIVRRIVGKSAQREGVLVDILAFVQPLANEVSAPDVMHQVAKFRAAEGVVTEILDDGASIGIGMRLLELLFRHSGISLEQKRGNLILPEQVNNFLVRENGVSERVTAARQQDQDSQYAGTGNTPPTGR